MNFKMSKYMSQLYNKRKTLENKIFDRSKVKKSEVDSCHNKLPKENNNLKLKGKCDLTSQ